MTGSYLVGLREGLEITLVVSILVAFLVKSDRRGRLPYVWLGVAAATALSVGLGASLIYGSAEHSHEQQELFDASASLVAVVFVTWMIFWMRRAARNMGRDLRGRLDEAISMGPLAVVVMAFLAVAREGLETAVLFFGTQQGSTTATPLVGLSLGVATAVAIGVLLYFGAVRINLSVFFRWTGLLLVLVAAGILKYGVHDLQEAAVLPGLHTELFDVTGVVPPDTWYAELLRGLVNLTPQPSVLEMLAWFAYGVPVLLLFLRPARSAPTAAVTLSPADARSSAAS